MIRPLNEVVASQCLMLQHRLTTPATEPNHLAAILERHTRETLTMLRKHPRVSLFEVNYPDLVRDPLPQIACIARFLGTERLPQPDAMSHVVKPQLHHQRSQP